MRVLAFQALDEIGELWSKSFATVRDPAGVGAQGLRSRRCDTEAPIPTKVSTEIEVRLEVGMS